MSSSENGRGKGWTANLRERLDEYFYDYYFGNYRRRVLRFSLIAAAAVLVLAIAGVVVLVTRDSSGPSRGVPAASSVPATVIDTAPSEPTSLSTPPTTDTTLSSDNVDTTADPDGTNPTATDSPTSTAEQTSTTRPATTTTASTTTAPESAPVETLPDGQPVPAVIVLDTDTVTLSGAVPSQAAADRLAFLAVAAASPRDVELVDELDINPQVPPTVAVRVIELTSEGFPEASAIVSASYASALDRIAAILQQLPKTSVLVVGHADDSGTEIENLAISDQRARSVINYFVFVGIDPSRLSSQAVGSAGPISPGDDGPSQALNRRVEFVLYGLLIDS